eukprot:19548-Eustigmatos_ZCMA.PRE.1
MSRYSEVLLSRVCCKFACELFTTEHGVDFDLRLIRGGGTAAMAQEWIESASGRCSSIQAAS